MPTGGPRHGRLALAIALVVFAYSAAHFLYSAVYSAWPVAGGDMLSAFPGPLTYRVTQLFPSLAKDWIKPGAAWNYGPVLHLLTLPFLFASSKFDAMHGMLLCDYVLVAATFAMWLRITAPRAPLLAGLAVACIWLNHFPLLEAVTGREIEIAELFLMTLALVLLREQREIAGGLAIGLAAMTKFLPAIFIPYLFLKGFYRAGWTALLTVVVFAFGAEWLLGWENSVTFFWVGKEQSGSVVPTAYANQAIINVLHKTFTSFNINDPRPLTLYPGPLHLVGLVVDAAVLFGTSWWLVVRRHSPRLEIEFALLVIVMCLLPPHANTYYFVFVLPALSIACVAALDRAPGEGRLLTATLALSVAASGFVLPMKAYELATGIQGMLVARVLQGWSLPAYGAILAATLMLAQDRAARAESRG
jgi:hypothetical protein